MEGRYREGFRKYRQWVESMNGWETVFCGYGWETFVYYCEMDGRFYDRWIKEDIKPIQYIEKFKLQ